MIVVLTTGYSSEFNLNKKLLVAKVYVFGKHFDGLAQSTAYNFMGFTLYPSDKASLALVPGTQPRTAKPLSGPIGKKKSELFSQSQMLTIDVLLADFT